MKKIIYLLVVCISLDLFFYSSQALAEPRREIVTLNIQGWEGYLNQFKEEWTKIFEISGKTLVLNFKKPDLTNSAELLEQLKGNFVDVDILGPGVSFFGEEPMLANYFYGINNSEIAAHYVNTSAKQGGKVSCVSLYGGYMSVYAKKNQKNKVNGFDSFFTTDFQKKYGLPKKEPWYIAFLVYEFLGVSSGERFSAVSLKSDNFQKKYKELIKNAAILYDDYNMSDEKFNQLELVYSWGFELPKVWEKSQKIREYPYFIDCLGITTQAAMNSGKLKAFKKIQKWLHSKAGQASIRKKLPGIFNISEVKLNDRFMYKGLKRTEREILNKLHQEAVAQFKP